ncbi:MAG: hypothetical protein KatS3mg115_2265 [Candidatus Poribacteria bacterium]|nr:MAG: hypothetical protein KatS3mg115_2265 [Candidatus Poribacteria bacterium]
MELRIQGTLERPQVELSATVLNASPGEEYALTTPEVLALLTFGNSALASEFGQEDLSAALDAFLRAVGGSLVGREVANLLGLDTVLPGVRSRLGRGHPIRALQAPSRPLGGDLLLDAGHRRTAAASNRIPDQ